MPVPVCGSSELQRFPQISDKSCCAFMQNVKLSNLCNQCVATDLLAKPETRDPIG